MIGALGAKAKSPWTILNPLRYWSLTNASAEAIRIDDSMGPDRAGPLRPGHDQRQPDVHDAQPARRPATPTGSSRDPDRAPAVFKAIIDDDTEPSRGPRAPRPGAPGDAYETLVVETTTTESPLLTLSTDPRR